ncbi:MAG TPA: hypothetical protein VFF32_15590 [Dermatophilaceae bacterium]|nr:hypothetical protein [Dermatophilaceae bacterium]
MARKKQKGPTYFTLMVQRVGFKKTRRAMEYGLCYLTVRVDLGHRPSMEEYAVWWKIGSATAFREQALWREAMPDFSTPEDFLRAVRPDFDWDRATAEDAGKVIGSLLGASA